MIEAHGFYVYPSRAAVMGVTQVPVVAAMKVGVTNVTSLAYLQSFGTVAMPILVWDGLLVALWRHRLFWPFAVIFAVTFLNSGFYSVGEYNLATALVALDAALLLRGELRRASGLVLVVSAGMLVLSYQTMAFLGVVLAAMTVVRLRAVTREMGARRWEVLVLWAALAFYVLGAALNVWWTVAPPYPIDLAPVSLPPPPDSHGHPFGEMIPRIGGVHELHPTSQNHDIPGFLARPRTMVVAPQG